MMNWLPKKDISEFKTHLEYRAYCKKRYQQMLNYNYRLEINYLKDKMLDNI